MHAIILIKKMIHRAYAFFTFFLIVQSCTACNYLERSILKTVKDPSVINVTQILSLIPKYKEQLDQSHDLVYYYFWNKRRDLLIDAFISSHKIRQEDIIDCINVYGSFEHKLSLVKILSSKKNDCIILLISAIKQKIHEIQSIKKMI